MRTRFAPSPTGYLHIGNVRTALLCWLYARKDGGKLLLRIDDTDTERSKPEYVEAIKEDLAWLGLDWDEIAFQSERFSYYDAAVEKLKNDGRFYACYETPEELAIKRKMQLSRGKPPIYDREGLKLSEAKKQEYEAEGRKPHWRFRLDDGAIAWDDEVHGHMHFEAANLSDPILIRGNGLYTYMLPSAVDDIELGVTHVLRGEDHISNTAIQIQLFEALGGSVPTFAHNALIKTKDGKLSKRKGGFTVRELREQGLEPMAIASFLAKVGTSDQIMVNQSLKNLAEDFDISHFNRAATTYDVVEIEHLNAKLLHQLPFEKVAAELSGLGITGVDVEFWNAVRPNITNLREVGEWWRICREPLSPVIEDGEFTKKAGGLLPDGEWHENTWKEWVDAVKLQTGRKGKELFMPLRQALTGMDHGPELKVLLPLIGRVRTEKRLNGEEG